MNKKSEVALAIGLNLLLVIVAINFVPIQLSEWLFEGLYEGEVLD